MAAGRLYMVEDGEEMTLVRSISAGKAIGHVTKGKFKCRVATADDVAFYMGAGGEVEISQEVADLEASGDPEPEQPAEEAAEAAAEE